MTQQYFRFLSNHKLADVITPDTIQNWGIEHELGTSLHQCNYRTWYHEEIEFREQLVITVGDSWTWGDHLGSIDWNRSIDDPVRLKQVFGKLTSTMLNADWINLAMPGCSNYWMLNKLHLLKSDLERLRHQYRRIDIVITLTEDFREAENMLEMEKLGTAYDYFWNKSQSLAGFLIKVEDFLLFNIEHFANMVPFVNVYVSRAFTDTWPQNNSKLLLDKTWCDVIQDHSRLPYYVKGVPFIGQLSIDPLTQNYIKDNFERKEEFLEIMKLVSTRWEFLGNSIYNLKGSTCHPNPEGHELWARYISSKLR